LNIDFNVTDILPDKWWELTKNVLSEKKFDREAFVELFKDTFEVLRYCACEDRVDKGLIELVKDIGGFSGTRFAHLNYEHLAACELADALLTNCLQCEKNDEPTMGKWHWCYMCDIELDFSNAEEALFVVTQEIETWENFSECEFADD
jgi:hypothetical protein